MLKIKSFPQGAFYVHDTMDLFWDPSGSVVNDVLLGPFSPVNYQVGTSTEIGSYDGYIVNDPLKDRVGDREVFHDQISGSLELPNFVTRDYTRAGYEMVFPVHEVQETSSKWKRFRLIGEPGYDFYQEWQSDDRYKTIYFARIAFDGKSFLTIRGNKRTVGGTNFNAYANNYTLFATTSTRASFYYSGWNVNSPQEIRNTPIRTNTSGSVTTKVWVKPKAASYSIEKLKECFYWLTLNAQDPGKFYPAYVEEDPNTYGDLCQACIEAARAVDVNTLSFLSELRDISTLIPKLGKVKDPKTWANLFLCYKYGALLTLADTKALLKGIESAYHGSRDLGVPATLRSSKYRGGTFRGLPFIEECRYKISYWPYPNDLMEVVRTLDRWGLYPTLTRDWDMIPFSFVVDWAVDVSSALERLDTHMIADYYNVIGVTRSRKVSFNLSATDLVPDWPGTGSITLSRYTRDTTPILNLPKVRFDVKEEGFRNWAELTALLIARKK